MSKKVELYDKSRDLTVDFELGHAENILIFESKKRKERRDWVLPDNSKYTFVDGKIRNVSASTGETEKTRKSTRSKAGSSEEVPK